MSKKLFVGTTNGLELWVVERALEHLKLEQENRRKKLLEVAGKKILQGYDPKSIDEAVQNMLNSFEQRGNCWIWLKLKVKGYGVTWLVKMWRVHRLMFFLTEYPNQMPVMVCHHCDTPDCGRCDHLFAGNGRLNSDDKIRKGRARWLAGDQSPVAKLSVEKVRDIRARYEPNTALTLAREFGVHKITVRNAAIGKTWRHVS